MGSIRERNAVVIALVAACVSAMAVWSASVTSQAARPRLESKGAIAAQAIALPTLATPDQPTRLRTIGEYGKIPLSFELNQGQTAGQVQFLSRGAGYTVFL